MTSLGAVSIKRYELIPNCTAWKNEWKWGGVEIARKGNSFSKVDLKHSKRTAGEGEKIGERSSVMPHPLPQPPTAATFPE